jgi:hypothetical protein
MKIKTFESWNDNIIDDTLFSSGKAKYNPKINAGIIRYKTGNAEPYYFAEIEKKGGKFVCKIYKKKKDGDKIRLRNKLKKDLKSAHNYVREFLNQKLKAKKKKSKNNDDDISDRIFKDTKSNMNIQNEQPFESPISLPPVDYTPIKSKTTIRRY